MDTFQNLRQIYGNEECEFCGRLFASRSDYEPHLRTHTGDRPFLCPSCPFRASTKDKLNRHKEKEHDKVMYICNTCDYSAHSRTQLWYHQKKHKAPSSYQCPKCKISLKGWVLEFGEYMCLAINNRFDDTSAKSYALMSRCVLRQVSRNLPLMIWK